MVILTGKYDGSCYLYRDGQRQPVESATLLSNGGAQFALAPGTYRIEAWFYRRLMLGYGSGLALPRKRDILLWLPLFWLCSFEWFSTYRRVLKVK